ncbi:MAG: glycosyltransferase family 39 protein [Alphaproteobacteria bacterium]|nr:glycosyltransferase family 39 protein [Alphaproteobacteria bacterium]
MQALAIELPVLLPLCLILLAAALALREALAGRPGPAFPGPLTLGLGMAAFLAVLLGFWASERSHHVLLGGLIPWNDAAGYFFGAHHLLESGELTAWSQRRPIYTSLLAGLLALGERDLQVALLLQAALVGAMACFAARAGASRMGPAAGLLVFALLLAFAGEQAPATMTENAGLLFGAAGIALLWLGLEKPRASWFAAAGFLLMLGLLARAGAFLVIPCLLLWAWLAFRDDRRAWPRLVCALLGGVLGAVLLNQAIDWQAGTAANMPFSNFAYHLYGLAAGGAEWTQIFADHPELREGGENAASGMALALTFERVLQNPFDFVIGYVRHLDHAVLHLFQYISFVPARAVIYGCWLAGLVAAWRHRGDPACLLLLLATAGTVLSSPFLFSNIGVRVYAATLAFDVYLAGLGLAVLIKRFRALPSITPRPGLPAQLAGVAGVLVALTLGGTFAFPKAEPDVQATLACEAAQMPAVLRLGSESPLVFLGAAPSLALFPPQARHGDFVALLHREVHLHEKLKRLPPDTALVTGPARQGPRRGKAVRIAWKTETLPPRGSLVGFCLKPDAHPLLGRAFRVPTRVQVFEPD